MSGSADSQHMVCSNCAFPLERLSGAQSKVCCPRCNTWLDIDPNCGGSCLKCHKTLSAEPASACTEASLVNIKEKNEEFPQDRVRKNQRTLLSRFTTVAGKARQYLTGKLIL